MLNRHLTDFGLHPVAGYLLLGLVFAGVSFFLFAQTTLAAYIYVLLALSFMFPLGQADRNDFLKTCFSAPQYFRIRLLENALLSLPFLLFLLYKGCWGHAGALLLVAALLAVAPTKSNLTFTLPTPFYRQPFEFVVGFRNTFYLVFAAWLLTVIAISVDNFNLGIFSLLLVFFICLSFYTQPESRYYVWIFVGNSRQFLWQKIKTALWFSTLLCLPVTLLLLTFFGSYAGIVLAFQALGYLYLLMIILGKYSAYPQPMSLPQSVFIVFSLWLPPLLLGIIPFFYVQAQKRLNETLYYD